MNLEKALFCTYLQLQYESGRDVMLIGLACQTSDSVQRLFYRGTSERSLGHCAMAALLCKISLNLLEK